MHYSRGLTSWSVRKKLLLLTFVVFLPAAGIVIASGIEQRLHEISMAKDKARLLAQSLVAQQEQISNSIEQMFITLAQLPAVQGLDRAVCSEIFRELLSRYPAYSTIGATTPDGRLFASALPFEPGTVDLSGRKHVKDVLDSLEFSTGEYQVGVVTKVPSIHYSYPVLDGDGRLAAILIVAFKLDEYRRFLSKVDLPEDSAVVIIDHKGVRLYRMPENDAAALGERLEDRYGQMENIDEGFCERRGDDGVFRICAFKRLRLREDSPPYMTIMVGISKE